MSDKPIIFSALMVRAILEGRKTMTRRIIKPQPEWVKDGVAFIGKRVGNIEALAPFAVGDTLWVRETWGLSKFPDPHNGKFMPRYRATNPFAEVIKWHPAIHMFKADSRISLEVTDVKAERVQDISEGDAKAEGCDGYVGGHGPVSELDLSIEPGYRHPSLYRHGFAYLWYSIHGPGAWERNDYVWAYTFRRLK